MSENAEYKILKLCKGKTIGQALHRLSLMEQHCANKKLELRVKTSTLIIGD